VLIIGLTILRDNGYFNLSLFVHIVHVIKLSLLLMPSVIILHCMSCLHSDKLKYPISPKIVEPIINTRKFSRETQQAADMTTARLVHST